MNKQWEIIATDAPYFSALSQKIGGAISLSSDRDDNGYINSIYSGYLEHLIDVDDVIARAAGLELVLNGAVRIARGDCYYIPIKFTEVVNLNTNATTSVLATTVDPNPFELPQGVNAPQYLPQMALKSKTAVLFNYAVNDEAVRTLLFYAGLVKTTDVTDKILAWSTLFKMYETVRAFCTPNGIDINNLYDSTRVAAFTTSANHMSILGIYARHSHGKGGRAPRNFITDLDEAIEIVFGLASSFCNEYMP
ncbi:hypothetical protein [Vibrio jasicida]|uniref:hypothetical protein n=1 Tax=Vibrio jasicida TaxID=766224 RepID=UPI00390A1A65